MLIVIITTAGATTITVIKYHKLLLRAKDPKVDSTSP